MQIKNFKKHPGISFEEYRALPGLSYSGIKKGDFVPTKKMMLGTAVHNYILEPDKYNGANREIVIPIARIILAQIGELVKHMETELSVTCNMEHEGLSMQYKGRIDMIRPGKLLIDLKISEIPLGRSIDHFGYGEQLTGYCLATNTPVGIIVRVCPKTLKTEKAMIRQNPAFWERQICKFGIPSNIAI
jgi:hypothetical protein